MACFLVTCLLPDPSPCLLAGGSGLRALTAPKERAFASTVSGADGPTNHETHAGRSLKRIANAVP